MLYHSPENTQRATSVADRGLYEVSSTLSAALQMKHESSAAWTNFYYTPPKKVQRRMFFRTKASWLRYTAKPVSNLLLRTIEF